MTAPGKQGQGHDGEHGQGAHGSGHATSGHVTSGHDEHHQEFNWYHGMIGEREGEPSLLWRPPGTPAPFAALLLNTCLLFFIIFKVARAPVMQGLRDRKQKIASAIDDAAAMKKEAEEQLARYQHKLDNLDAEIERVKKEMGESAESERRRVLEEAKARRLRLEQEARQLVEQELADLRDQLTRETARAALRSARELLQKNASTEDHRRLCEQYLASLVDRPAITPSARS
jgi:F0F1-type ATP synthase membrane subunit b/b'